VVRETYHLAVPLRRRLLVCQQAAAVVVAIQPAPAMLEELEEGRAVLWLDLAQAHLEALVAVVAAWMVQLTAFTA
jgi:hypothetical protein